MAQIATSELTEGMMFSEPVYVEGENLLVPPRIPLRQKDIDRLLRWEVDVVETTGQVMTAEDLKQERQSQVLGKKENVLADFYTERLEKLGAIFRRLAHQEEVEQDEVDAIGGELLQQVISERNEAITLIFSNPKADNQLALRSMNSTVIGLVIGLTLKLNSHRLMQLATGGLMHDVGMLQVSEDIMAKSDKLTDEELKQIHTHTLLGYQFLSKTMRYPEDIAVMALQHHERWDGTGYPRKLKGEEIKPMARIIALADAYEAMIKDRPYRTSMIGYNAVKSILGDNGRHFDPKYLKAFLTSMGIYPVGSIVQLNDSSIGRVTSPNGEAPLRPRIELLVDADGTRLETPRPVNLQERTQVFIAKAVDPREYASA
jgi:HD-GYP domain-containing protein (c-di-GMP phosphodiesterase class II)